MLLRADEMYHGPNIQFEFLRSSIQQVVMLLLGQMINCWQYESIGDLYVDPVSSTT